MKIRITVMPRKTIADPQGRNVAQVLHSLGCAFVQDMRIGKTIDVTVDDMPREQALERASAMARDVLANNVIEDFTVEILT